MRGCIRALGVAVTIAKLHVKARRAVEAGEHKFREAAECLAAAKKLGATQRQSARAIGKSPSWVNVLLKWRQSGYKGGAFDRSNKSRVLSRTKQSPRPMTVEQAEAMKARAEAVARLFPPLVKTIPEAARAELIAALRMLAKSRDTAALLVERQRARLNLTWSDLLVPSDENQSALRVGPAQRPFRVASAA
jgi:hypothetical protein